MIKMWYSTIFYLLATLSLWQYGEAIMCHRCNSAMGGCGEELNWQMFPWKSCPDSQFCVKYIQKSGAYHHIIRDCEETFLKTTKHRLQIPNLRRHGYCLNARKNSAAQPLTVEDKSIQYCFCNDWNGCNAASGLSVHFMAIFAFSSFIAFYIRKLL